MRLAAGYRGPYDLQDHTPPKLQNGDRKYSCSAPPGASEGRHLLLPSGAAVMSQGWTVCATLGGFAEPLSHMAGVMAGVGMG